MIQNTQHVITTTFNVKEQNARRVQLLVGKYNGWFVCNPFPMFNNQLQFKISFTDGKDYAKFSRRINIISQPYF